MGTEFLKWTVSYIWSTAKDDAVVNAYRIATWLKKVTHSFISKHGTEEDIAKLLPETAHNKGHSMKRGGWSITQTGVRRVPK